MLGTSPHAILLWWPSRQICLRLMHLRLTIRNVRAININVERYFQIMRSSKILRTSTIVCKSMVSRPQLNSAWSSTTLSFLSFIIHWAIDINVLLTQVKMLQFNWMKKQQSASHYTMNTQSNSVSSLMKPNTMEVSLWDSKELQIPILILTRAHTVT